MLKRLPALIDGVFPLPLRFRSGLKRDVAELSRLLTSGREERGASYLGKPALLSAYLRYFLPWNIYRLCRLFAALPLELKAGDAVNDLGAGPLTLAASLWISRPDLRNIPLEFRCLDRTAVVLEAGKKIFSALAAGTSGHAGSGNGNTASHSPPCPWEIRTIHGELRLGRGKSGDARRPAGLSAEIRGKPAALSAAINVYNELFWNFSPVDTDGLKQFAGNQARLLSSLTEKSGSILVVEPGIPRSGEFIAMLRSGLTEESRLPLSPCVHSGPCPLPGGRLAGRAGGKAKWCHFAFDTDDAPEELQRLSAAAGIPKERAVLSFILAGPVSADIKAKTGSMIGAENTGRLPANAGRPVKIRVISDAFPAGGNGAGKRGQGNESWVRYGCCERGLVLVTGSRENLESAASGALEELTIGDGLLDAKSGALIAARS